MIRLVPQSIYRHVCQRAKRFDYQGVVPQHNSIALTIACRQRAANDWSCWIVEPFLTGNRFLAWWQGRKPMLPAWQPDLSCERTIIWNNAAVQRGLAVQEALLQPERYRFDRFAGLEIVAYSIARDLCRIWYIDWQHPFAPGVDPRTIKAGQPSSKFSPHVDDSLKQHTLQLHARFKATAGKRCIISKEGISYADRH